MDLYLVFVGFHGEASAVEVPVSVSVVDASDVGPEFLVLYPGKGEGSLFPAVVVRPLCGGDNLHRVGCVLEWVAFFVELALFDVYDFFSDGNHSIAEPIEFGFAFALRGLNH